MTTAVKRKIPTTAEVLAQQKRDHEKPPAKSTAVAKPATTDLAVPDNPWMEVSNVLDQFVGAPRLKFTKDGEFAISDTETIPAGTRCIAHVDALEFGWVKWADNQPVERRSGRVADRYKPVPRSELGDLDETQWEIQPDGTRRDPWQFQARLPLTRLDTDETLDFTTGIERRAARGRSAVAGVRQARRQAAEEPADRRAAAGHYKHRQYGKIYVPALHIVGWTDDDGVPLSTAADLNDEIPHCDPQSARSSQPTGRLFSATRGGFPRIARGA